MSETELIGRIERLERDNRQLKKFGAALLVVAAILGTMAATRPVPDLIQAHEFQLVDSTGKVRASLHAAYGMASVSVYGDHVFPALDMSVGPDNSMALRFYKSPDDVPLSMEVNAGQPTIHLTDPQGYRMDLGTTKTVTPATGETYKTSAASIVMFGNDKKHHVIWQAPR